MADSPGREAEGPAAGPETSCLLWNQSTYYCLHKGHVLNHNVTSH
jgi:hypothetical protein